jgi:hypothetical protein
LQAGETTCGLTVQSLSLLSKINEKNFPSLDVSSFDWVRNPLVLRVLESAELTVAEKMS